MVQATTPTFMLTLPEGLDLSEATNIYFTLQQGNVDVRKDNLTVTGQTISVYLTQAETLPFKAGIAKLQLNWIFADGSRACSNIVSIHVGDNLIDEVLP